MLPIGWFGSKGSSLSFLGVEAERPQNRALHGCIVFVWCFTLANAWRWFEDKGGLLCLVLCARIVRIGMAVPMDAIRDSTKATSWATATARQPNRIGCPAGLAFFWIRVCNVVFAAFSFGPMLIFANVGMRSWALMPQNPVSIPSLHSWGFWKASFWYFLAMSESLTDRTEP